jgi:hypothetical protein
MQTLKDLFDRVRAAERTKDPKDLQKIIGSIAAEMYNEVIDLARGSRVNAQAVIRRMNLAHKLWNELVSRWPTYFAQDDFANLIRHRSSDLYDEWQQLRSQGFTQTE